MNLRMAVSAIAILCASITGAPAQSVDTAPPAIRSPQQLAKWLDSEFTYELKFPDSRQTPEETIASRKGDCEDFAILSREILRQIGIRAEVVIIKFSKIGIFHAICLFKTGDSYSFISNKELVRTKAATVAAAVSEKFPDWEKVTYLNDAGELGQVLERRYTAGYADSLAIPSLYEDMLGYSHRDMGVIRLLLEEQLSGLSKAPIAVSAGTFVTILKDRQFTQSTPRGLYAVRFVYRSLTLTNGGFAIVCKARDGDQERRYHAVFTLRAKASEGFFVTVLTEREWERYSAAQAFPPHSEMGIESGKGPQRGINGSRVAGSAATLPKEPLPQ